MTQKNFRVRKGLTIAGETTGSTSLAAANTGTDQSYTLPTALPAVNGYVLASQTDGTMSWVANPDVNTTYDFNATAATGGANLNLVGSDSTTDTVKLTNGGHITATYTSGTEVTLGSDATSANTASAIVSRDSSGNFSAGAITLANGAVLKDTSGEAVAYGQGAGTTSQGDGALAFGYNAGNSSQGQYAVASGYAAGTTSQGQYSVAVGNQAGNGSQGTSAVAVGAQAGESGQGNYAVAVGAGAGVLNQGEASIAIGYFAGNGTTNAQPARTIILNATGAELDGVASQPDRLYIAPIRNATSSSGVLQYDATTKEVTYNTLPAATTYDFNASSTTGGANLNLAGSDATTDTVKLTNGNHITATYTSATEVTLGSDATDANTVSTIVARDGSGNFSAGTISMTKGLVGSTANFTDWPNAQMVVSQANGGDTHTYNIGLVGEAVATSADANRWGVGVYGNGFTNGGVRSAGVLGDGSVTNTADTGSAIGVRGYATDTHAGGLNIGLFGEASGGLSNYGLYTNGGDWAATGAVSIVTLGSNGSITLAPNGTGSVVNTFSNGGNLSSNRNIITGAIRNSTTASIGDIWAVNSTGPVQPFRGVSVDNSADTTKNAGYVARNYNNTAANRSRLIFERARFTGTVATPAALQSGDFMGEVCATGYTSTGWLNDNVAAVTPAFFGFQASENWVSNTNIGTQFGLSLAPTGTGIPAITAGTQLVQVLALTPQASNLRSDSWSFQVGKEANLSSSPNSFTATGSSISGTTLTIGTVTAGSVQVGQFIQTATFSILPGTYIVSGSGSTWTVSQSQTVASSTIVGTGGQMFLNKTGDLDIIGDLRVVGNDIKNSAGTTAITMSASNVAFAQPVKFPVYTAAALTAITGAVGWQASVSNSPTVGGRMAFWDTTNARWSYISDNSAV